METKCPTSRLMYSLFAVYLLICRRLCWCWRHSNYNIVLFVTHHTIGRFEASLTALQHWHQQQHKTEEKKERKKKGIIKQKVKERKFEGRKKINKRLIKREIERWEIANIDTSGCKLLQCFRRINVRLWILHVYEYVWFSFVAVMRVCYACTVVYTVVKFV